MKTSEHLKLQRAWEAQTDFENNPSQEHARARRNYRSEAGFPVPGPWESEHHSIYHDAAEDLCWLRVGRKCVICGEKDWCWSNDKSTVVVCSRNNTAPDGRHGYSVVLHTGDQSWLFVMNQEPAETVQPQPQPETPNSDVSIPKHLRPGLEALAALKGTDCTLQDVASAAFRLLIRESVRVLLTPLGITTEDEEPF